MRHDSNNGEPRSFVSESDVLTDGILAGKVLARENLVYDGDLLGGFTIAVGEVAALLKGDSQRCEISRRNHANAAVRTGIVRALRTSLDGKARHTPVVTEWQGVNQRG